MSHKEDLTSLLTPEQDKLVIEARGNIGYRNSEEAKWVRGKVAFSRGRDNSGGDQHRDLEQDKYQISEDQRA